jgi:outer membrane protein assembly factor BamB
LGKDRLSALFYLSLEEDVSQSDMNAAIQSNFGEEVIVNERRYETVLLRDVSFKSSARIKGFSYVITDGLLIAGTSSILLEDAVRSLNSAGGIYNQDGFKKVAATAGKYVLGNLYLNYAYLDQLFLPLVSSEMQHEYSPLPDLAVWGEFDLDLRKNAWLLNGMTYADDSLKGWLNLFREQSPVRLEAPSFIPSNAIEFLAVGISDIQQFSNAFIEELKIREQYPAFQLADNNSRKTLGESMFTQILELINDEIAWFTLEDNRNEHFSEVVMIEVRSRSAARDLLTGWVSEMAALRGEGMQIYTDNYQLDDQVSYTIYSLPEQFYNLSIIGRFIRSHFAFYDNYIIFSDSKEAVSRTIYQNVLQKTLKNELYFGELNNLLSTKANLTYFLRPEPYLLMKEHLLKKQVRRFSEDISGTIRKIPGVIVQYAREGEMFYSNISLAYSSKLKERAHTVWESLLDSTVRNKPYLVINHYTSEREILVQDTKNSLYLINSTGRILWKVPLDGPILSEAIQVDYYTNGKLQYLFNTAGGIHLIDRNGNYVDRYPVKLRADATNGIAMFDYDNRRDYRIFVACEDRRVYAYDLEGRIVPGWSFRRSEGRVHKPVQHFRIADKDYIVFSDQIRPYILNRRGDERILIKEPVVVSDNNIFYLDMNISGKGPRFITTDATGAVIGINLNGEVDRVLDHSATSGHFFRIRDINQDGQTELIFANENLLEVLDLKGERLFSYKIKSDISTIPDIYQFSSSDLKIGLTDVDNNMIYLINSDGTVYEGFPLEGNTRYSIGYFAGSDSRFNLVVGNQNGFLYNYSIE